ncbi:MAG TPA: rRNA adenine N-6-methyltransferase family protein [Candidatus Binatia bacterium]|nr:rRNA adenine N-6-methyltransferase family protein [Candidatus Binatia bacterium]
MTEDADPRHVYRDVPVAIDRKRLLNNGQPSIVACLIQALALRPGAHAVHVGSGTGYFTAILAEVVGENGSVTAVEYDAELAERARANLADRPNVTVVRADGNAYDPGPSDGILVNAGATLLRRLWVQSLREGGRLVLPLTGPHAWGNVLVVTRRAGTFDARFLDPTGIVIFPCVGGRDDADAERLASAYAAGRAGEVRRLLLEPHAPSASCWLHRDDSCLSL